MTRFTTLTIATLMSLGALTASAQPGGGILSLDSDGDGRVSRDEFQPPQHRRGPNLFARADADGDGTVTREELGVAIEEGRDEREQRMLGMFDEMDSDGNGVVTQIEAADHAFARVDADGDGFVTEEEANNMRRRGKGKRQRQGQRS